MEPRKHTLAELFEGQLVYVVPNYQRLYVWNQEDQWAPLWSDIEEIASLLVSKSRSTNSERIDSDSVEAHFLGAVVLKLSGSTPDLARQIRVVDGQQRLTTLQLLIAAAVTELERLNLSRSADRLRELLANSSRSVSPGTSSCKINHHRHQRGHDYERFSDVIAAALNGGEAENISGPMSKCYQFFLQVIRAWLDNNQDQINLAAAALATTLIMKLNLVSIYLDPHEKEHIIFETLNARGQPLTEWDKIKNFLLYKADEDPDLNQESFFEDYLDHFDDPWWRTLVGRGAQRPRADIFADYWLESRKRSPVAVRRVYREFERHVNNEGQHLQGVMQALTKDAEYFRKFEEPNPSNMSREAQFHKRRLDLDLGAIWPLLLELQRIEAEQSERDRWFSALESYFIRRMIVGYQARSYDQVTLDLLQVLASASGRGTGVGDAIVEHLLQYSEAASLWPSNAELKQAVLTRHLPVYAQRLVLTAIEQHLIPGNAGQPYVSPSVQIEHIMPRGWQPESWPLPDSVESPLAEDNREHVINTVGNLTLLNGRLNSSISNAPWTRKRSEIKKSDNLFINRRLLEYAPNGWTEDDIYTRGEWMYTSIVEIWPREG